MQDRELYSIEEARALLGCIARNTIYELMRAASLAQRRDRAAAVRLCGFNQRFCRRGFDHGLPNGQQREIRFVPMRQMTLEFKTQLASRAQGAR